MNVEVSIAERLEKLRQWQVEQQERLLKQQRIQREILSHEQDRIYKALGLPMNDFNIIESTEDMCAMDEIGMNARETMSDEALMLQCSAKNSNNILEIIDKKMLTNADPSYENCNEEESNNLNHASTIVDRSRNFMKDCNSGVLAQELSDSLIEGIKPLSLNNVSNRCIVIDDIPVPSPKKDFQTLLEEKLTRESEIMPNVQTDAKIKPKKPFLKKGQGLSRFKMSTNLHRPTVITKKHNTSSNTQHIDKSNKRKKSTMHKPAKTLDNVSVRNGERRLNLKTVPPPKKKAFSKSITPTNQITHNVTPNRSSNPLEMNISDCDSKAEKELEEVRIFELLEEKAENSSFCSTSSTVLAFLQQSTPFKVKSRFNQTRKEDDTVASKEDERTSDMIEQEPLVQQIAHIGNSKSNVQRQVESRKHSFTNATTVDSWNTVTVDNIQEETQNYFTKQILQNEAFKYTKHSENHDTSSTVSSSDEERDTRNDRNLTNDSEADVSHHVRFSEYNEYRTINLNDVSDTASSSPTSQDYLAEQSRYDYFAKTSKSSDIKRKLPFNCDEQIHNSSPKIISDEKAVDISGRSSLQQDVTCSKNDLYNCILKMLQVPEENDTLSYKDEWSEEDTCYDNKCMPIIRKVAQISDEEQSVLSVSSSSSSDSRELNTHKRKDILRTEPEKITEEIADICSDLREADLCSSEKRTNQMSTYETELLKSRLLELEKEIDIFRKESSALLLQRRKLQEEETILRKQYAEKEKNFEEIKRRVQNQLEEEKKRVTREKAAMENRIRDAQEKAKQSKMERQKAQNLREQMEQLRDELNIKESRWNAAESRYKSELRVLRVEISKLKQEIANSQKRTNVRNLKKSTGQVITKAINQINKRVVVASSKEPSPMKMCQDLSNTSSDTSVHSDSDDEDEQKDGVVSVMKINVNDGFGQTEDNVSVNKIKYKSDEIESQPKGNKKFPNVVGKKQYLYENLLKDATSDLIENQNPIYTKHTLNDPQSMVTQTQNLNVKSNDRSCSSSINKDPGHTAYAASNIEHYAGKSHEVNQDSDENDMRMEEEKRKDRILSSERNLNYTLQPSFQSPIKTSPSKTSSTSTDDVKQIKFSDGRIEYWYPNGNVKKIFPDQEITKLIYYNGDVREIDKTRRVKYFYAATRTWHTTTPDGIEILEFPEYVYFLVSSLRFFLLVPIRCFVLFAK